MMTTIGRKRTPDGSVKRSDDTGGDAGNGGHEETQLDPIKRGWKIERGPPSYVHARLPWVYEQQWRKTTHAYDHGFRMTSIYDPYIGTTEFDINADGATVTMAGKLDEESADGPTDSRGRNVAYLDYYTSLYKYYSVLSCRYTVRVENLSHEPFYVHTMFVNDTNPPSEASNWDMLIWKGVRSYLVQPYMKFTEPSAVRVREAHAIDINEDDDNMEDPTTGNNVSTSTSVINNPIGSQFAYIKGEYRPGDLDQAIADDDNVSIYTPVAANPDLREALLVRVRPYDNASVPADGEAGQVYMRNLTYKITVECEYLVEFKELKDPIRWPVTRNPITVTVTTDPTTGGQ